LVAVFIPGGVVIWVLMTPSNSDAASISLLKASTAILCAPPTRTLSK
jgi:hypothetical protein